MHHVIYSIVYITTPHIHAYVKNEMFADQTNKRESPAVAPPPQLSSLLLYVWISQQQQQQPSSRRRRRRTADYSQIKKSLCDFTKIRSVHTIGHTGLCSSAFTLLAVKAPGPSRTAGVLRIR